ncbi:SDR family NAD(P)-dependent oxidoreductase [Desulfovibrio sp.]|uniref:SDR family NAD(P)-dependent oxidoreductase n=1 Tax=Desulfovibrio sp. TaxID=885 RepID=UPI0023CE3DAE|nr:SDR family NAD(P)-dependent oxidoreductase [Desulfovibrio sp.]MDE7240989.1 SDR family NAD(P)-dependent oxidoreductase [Desulfovibrio sp.]
MTDRKTWLITGTSSGLGKWLATEALRQGNRVVLTARNTADVEELASRHPETALAARLDVTDGGSIGSAVSAALEKFGAIDVLVNNAGYALRGAAEECSLAEVMREFDVDFFGPVRCVQAVLPHMRKAGSGLIINYSSIAALSYTAGSPFYSAAKSALEAFSDSMRLEVEPLGIKVMVVEPGPFHTNFHDRSISISPNSIADYAPTAHKRKLRLANPESAGTGFGDPQKAALVVLKAAAEATPPRHLVLGSHAWQRAETALKKRLEELADWKSLSVQSDKER